MLAHFLLIISIRKGIPNAAKRSVKAEGKSPRTPRKSISKESVSKATSELNNLLQIISGTSAEIGNLWEGSEGSDQYLKMPRSKPTILVVDDEQMALVLIKRLLSESGYQVVTAQSGFEALDLFRRQPQAFQLVLLDLTMPFMDGEETFHRLREIRADIPVVLCTGFMRGDRLDRLMKAGIAGFLRKPLAPDEIVDHIRGVLESVKYARHGGALPDGSSIAG